ncbi:MAG: V-type ATP synthase subunit E family protein [Nanobdellota archaeon]
MSFENLKKKVEKETEAERQKILNEAKNKAKEIVSQAENEARQEEERRMEELEKQIDFKRTQEIASAKLEQKKKKLMARKEMLDKVFTSVPPRLGKKLTAAKRKKLLQSLLKAAEKEIAIARVHCNTTDAKHISVDEKQTTDMLGGLIAENKDGSVRIDYSFETLLDEVKNQYLADINRILFENV